MDEFAGDRPFPRLPILPDDLLLEILLRLPPEPIYLFRASVVSKHWRGLIHDAGFLRRFRDFHGGTPPVLGFFNQPGPPLFVPTAGGFAASAAAKKSPEDWWALDCRHGRALLLNRHSSALVVWDILTGDERYLPMPPVLPRVGACNGAVLRAGGHGDCHSCPFQVVLSRSSFLACACVFSSETGVWSEINDIVMPFLSVEAKPTALVGNTLYWLWESCTIVEFDLDSHRLDFITEGTLYDVLESYGWEMFIVPTVDGLLGFARVEGFNLHLWSLVKSFDGSEHGHVKGSLISRSFLCHKWWRRVWLECRQLALLKNLA